VPDQTGITNYLPSNRVIHGENALLTLPELIMEFGCRAVLVVTDQGITSAGHLDSLTKLLGQTDSQHWVFSDVEENPTTVHVDNGLAFAKSLPDLDLIIAIGGGSVMDCAKGINFLYTNGGRMQDYWGKNKAAKPMLPAIGIPTTAGTGSEAQSFALITDPQSHRKMACGDIKARFRTVILDPLLVKTAPHHVMAVTALDAISHAVESFVSTVRNPFSTLFAREAWRLLSTHLEDVLGDNDDVEALIQMQLGAYLAGLAIENSMLGAAHACANPLTARYGLTHGIAVGLLLPHIVVFNATTVEPLYEELLDGGSERLAMRLREFLEISGIEPRLRDYGIPVAGLPGLASLATDEWTGKFNPRAVDEAAFLELYELAF
jgi:alcohol dehydrogenase